MQWKDPATGTLLSIYHTKEFERDLRQWGEAACQHPSIELRWALDASKRRALRHQCLSCGFLVGPAKRQSEAPPDTPNADTSKWPRHEQARKDALNAIYRKHVAIQERDETNFRGQHAAYLQSDAWKAKRAKVLARARGICEGCGDQIATQVHHLSYEHWQDELLFELVALCRACHRRVHGVDEDDKDIGDD